LKFNTKELHYELRPQQELRGNLFDYNIKSSQKTSNISTPEPLYCNLIEKAIKNNDPTECEILRNGKADSAYIIHKVNSCKAQYAIKTENLEYCLTLSEDSNRQWSTPAEDICITALAQKFKDPSICVNLYNNLTLEYCKTNALKPIKDIPCRNAPVQGPV